MCVILQHRQHLLYTRGKINTRIYWYRGCSVMTTAPPGAISQVQSDLGRRTEKERQIQPVTTHSTYRANKNQKLKKETPQHPGLLSNFLAVALMTTLANLRAKLLLVTFVITDYQSTQSTTIKQIGFIQ